jgi:hypothetical protein
MLLGPDERIRRNDWSWHSVEEDEKGKVQEHHLGEAGGSVKVSSVAGRDDHCTHGQDIKYAVRRQRA